MFVPAPTHSKEIDVAICKLILAKYAVVPALTLLFRLDIKVIVEIPEDGKVALSMA